MKLHATISQVPGRMKLNISCELSVSPRKMTPPLPGSSPENDGVKTAIREGKKFLRVEVFAGACWGRNGWKLQAMRGLRFSSVWSRTCFC